MFQTRRRAATLAAGLVLVLGLGVFADDLTVVTNRGSNVISLFNSGTNTELIGSPVTVGTTPVDVCSDATAVQPAIKWYVANAGSNSVSIVQKSPLGLITTVSSDGFLGTLQAPQGVAFIGDPAVGPVAAVIDQKVTTYIDAGPPVHTAAGRGSIRFISAITHTVIDAFQEPSSTAHWTHVVSTSNRRLWIADDGDQGVSVIRFYAPVGAPYYYPQVINYQGSLEFADFIRDTAATKTFMLAPKRLATNGTTRVVVADGGSKIVTILDANYIPTNVIGEPGAVLSNVDLSLAPGASAGAFGCASVAVVGNFAYVTTTNDPAAGDNVFQIDLTTFAVASSVALGGVTGVAGVGGTSDGTKLYVGEAAGGANGLFELDVNPSTDFAVTPPVAVAAFTGGSVPFAFSSNSSVPTGGGGGGVWTNVSTGVSTGHGSVCGLLGLEAVLLLLGLALLRRA